MFVHWFNPENDLALASGKRNYTPPTAARQLHEAGGALPLWYAAPGDKVLTYGVPEEWFERMVRDFRLEADLFDHVTSRDTIPSPWGWSEYARTFFLDEGFDSSVLPSPEGMDTLRRLSGRGTAAEVARKLIGRVPQLIINDVPIEIKDPSELEKMLNERTDLVLKSPWSSSGRGVVIVKDVGYDRALRMGCDSIRRQGSVMVETCFDKVLDFARLFECRDGKCLDLGTSVFTTDSSGAYTGNLIASEAERLSVIAGYFSLDSLAEVTSALRSILEEIYAPHCDGILGVDMLVTADGRLDAVVEVNVRKTMGYVANEIARRYVADGVRGTFSVVPLRGNEAPEDDYVAEHGRLVRGTLNLVPPDDTFAFLLRCP